jgi:hypothetical protein
MENLSSKNLRACGVFPPPYHKFYSDICWSEKSLFLLSLKIYADIICIYLIKMQFYRVLELIV